MSKSLRRFATFLFVRFLVTLAFLLPRRAGRAFFGGLGGLAYQFLGPSRKVALANLRLVYDGKYTEPQLKEMARQAFSNLGTFAYDAVNMGRYTEKDLENMVETDGMDRLESLLSGGRGVIGLTGHIGNWELLGGYLALRGYPINVLATRVKNKRLDSLLVGIRESAGMKVLERSSSLLGAFRCLRKGEVLGVLIDLDTSVESVVVDFLGHPAKTPVGPVKLASGTGGAIVPMVMLMTSEGKYRIEIKEPVSIGGNGDTLQADVEKCSKAIEEFIRSEPTQWLWMHKRWKSVAAGLYK